MLSLIIGTRKDGSSNRNVRKNKLNRPIEPLTLLPEKNYTDNNYSLQKIYSLDFQINKMFKNILCF